MFLSTFCAPSVLSLAVFYSINLLNISATIPSGTQFLLMPTFSSPSRLTLDAFKISLCTDTLLMIIHCCNCRSMPTSAALDVVAKNLNLKFFEVKC